MGGFPRLEAVVSGEVDFYETTVVIDIEFKSENINIVFNVNPKICWSFLKLFLEMKRLLFRLMEMSHVFVIVKLILKLISMADLFICSSFTSFLGGAHNGAGNMTSSSTSIKTVNGKQIVTKR